ncbi:MATE family efflux transporter [Ruminococcus sp. OA3]|uniref:MATE family efflux transporter n=1 Tax=Ruminococcus sp. OA3 TaxID=2914164 RepID=UPI001F05D429|nr:MATE family efflux transporter [Ruminococcus sp. OA3]MCH1983211.1 MATE family efflux transporter [Ruminococcus sp. OA3]
MRFTEIQNTQKSIASVLIKFSIPLILSGVLQQLYNWADAFIVGNVEGELALAAIGATGTVINFYLMAITGFTLGLSILFARKAGSGDTGFISKILSTYSILLGIVFVLLAAAGIWLTPPILHLMHTTQNTVHLAEDYLQIIFAGIPFLAVYNVYSAALRGIGDSRAPFLAVLVSSVINVLLDILFVAVLHLGVGGAAGATVISQAAMTTFLIVYAVITHSKLRFRFKQAIHRKALLQGLRLGFPPMIQSSVSAFGSLLLQNFMNGFGTQTVAAITTAYRVDTIILLPIINLGSGISTIVAQSHGAGKIKETQRIFASGTAIMTAVSLFLTLLVIPTGGRLISMFGVGKDAAEIGQDFFQRIACFYLIYGLATALRGYLEGIGHLLYSSIAGIASLVFRIFASYTMAALFHNMVIAYAEGFSWGILLLLYLIRLMQKRRPKDK